MLHFGDGTSTREVTPDIACEWAIDPGSSMHVKINYPKRRWPDFLWVRAPTVASLIVSSRVANDLGDAGINNFETRPIRFRDPIESPPKSYVALLPPGGASSPGFHGFDRSVFQTNMVVDARAALTKGLDLFSINCPFTGQYSVRSCAATRRIIEIARAKRWTNAAFVPLGYPYSLFSSDPVLIDPFSTQWPPQWRPALPFERSPEEWLAFQRNAGPAARYRFAFEFAFALFVRQDEILPLFFEITDSDNIYDLKMARTVVVRFCNVIRSHGEWTEGIDESIVEEAARHAALLNKAIEQRSAAQPGPTQQSAQ